MYVYNVDFCAFIVDFLWVLAQNSICLFFISDLQVFVCLSSCCFVYLKITFFRLV